VKHRADAVKAKPNIGDPVEVRVTLRTRLGDLATWVPATVVTVPRNGSIGVAFSDGDRMAVRRGLWRRTLGR
jgi:hypothetical protein